jgi:hypothetical protein
MVFLDKPETNRYQIKSWFSKFIEAKKCDPKLLDRVFFRPFSPDTPAFCQLIDAVLNEGEGGLSIDSFDSVGPNTSAQDTLMRGLPFFACDDESAPMAARVGAELARAARLTDACVGKSPEETLKKAVEYRQNLVLQARVKEHLRNLIDNKLALFSRTRIPRAWKTAIDHYLGVLRAADGDKSKLQDYNIPPDGDPVTALIVDPHEENVRFIFGQMDGFEVEMKDDIRDLLRGLKAYTGCEYLRVAGKGTFVNTICVKFRHGGLGALKMGLQACDSRRIHNHSITREAAILSAAHERLRNCPNSPVIAEPLYILEDGTSFWGASKPNSEGKSILFLFCEYLSEDFDERCKQHTTIWQEHGLLTEGFRIEVCNTVFLTLHHAQAIGLFCMDLKQNNIRIRGDGVHKGRAAITDLGNGHLFPVENAHRPVLPVLLSRQTTEAAAKDEADAPGRKKKKPLPPGLLQVPRSKKGALLVPITREQTKEFQRRASMRGLAKLGGSTVGFKDRVDQRQEANRRFAIGAGKKANFERKWAAVADLFAAFRMILMILTRRNKEKIQDWNARAIAAEDAGQAGIRKMLLEAVNPAIRVQQTMALDRLVDWLTGGLRQGERFNIIDAMGHVANTLPILSLQHEVTLNSGCGIRLPGGRVRDLCFNCPYKELLDLEMPDVELCLQEDMGMGARAKQDIEEGECIGAYVGELVPNHEIGTKYITPFFPSRFVAIISGDGQLLKQSHIAKLSCDAQPTLERDFEWARTNNVVGPYLNAAAEGNCALDRVRAWKDPTTGLLCMLMFSSKPIKKGEFLMWPYDPNAGPGWSFK